MRSLDDDGSKGSSSPSVAAVGVVCALYVPYFSRSCWSHVENAVDAQLFQKPPIFGVCTAPDEKVVQDARRSLVVAAGAAHRALPVPCPLRLATGARSGAECGGFFSKRFLFPFFS